VVSKLKAMWSIYLFPIIVGLLVFSNYGFQWSKFYNMMGITFFLSFPYIIGVVSILFAPIEKISSLKYRLFHPWKILGIVVFITMVFRWEGWACWIMLVPILGIFLSLGGQVAGHFRLSQNKKGQQMNVSLMLLLPLIASPLESMMKIEPKVVETRSEIVIAAPAEKIWGNVTRVYTITKEEDKSRLTRLFDFPSPLEATLDKLEVGGYRKAMFTDGLVFHEKVTEYEDKKRMFFTINANTHEIPSTTFDHHLLIGGDYFDMLDGEYKLEKIDERHYKVLLNSHFKVSTTFNWYAGFLGQMIMSDIQDNILQIVKRRSES